MKNEQVRAKIDYYLSLDYPITIHHDPEGGFVGEIEDLPGCMTQAESLDELYEAMEEARRAWIEAAYENGQDIPVPRELDEHKGKILVRVSRSLHRQLARAAKREGVSLNQYITGILAAGVHGDLLAAQSIELLEASASKLPRADWLAVIPIFGTDQIPKRLIEIKPLKRVELPTE
jgi:antitoxin HicB